MTKDQVHMIGQSIVDLVIHSSDYRDVQDEAADLFKTKLSDAVNRLFDEVNAGSLNSYFFQQLRIDLGTIERSNFTKEFEKRLLEQLRLSLGKIKKNKQSSSVDKEQVTIRPEPDSRFELLTHFLSKGFLPWQSPVKNDQSLEQLFAACIAGEPLRIRQFLFHQGANELLVRRIVFQFSEKLVYSLIEVLEPAEAAFIIAYLEKLKKGHRRRHFVKKDPQHFERVRLRVTLSYLLDRGDSYFNRKEFVKSTLHSVAQHYNITYREVMNWFMTVLEEENELRDSKSELAVIIREIAEAEPAAIEAINDEPESITGRRATFFEKAVFAEGNSIIVLLRNDNETRFFINSHKDDFNESLREFLFNRKMIKAESATIAVLYEDHLFSNDTSVNNTISTSQLAAGFRQYIGKGYMSTRRVFGKHEHVRHLLTVWLKHYPHQFKLLLRLLIPEMESGNSKIQSTAKLHRALYLFFGNKAARMSGITNELLALPAYYTSTINASYFRQFVILKALHYTGKPVDTSAYRKYLMTALTREFRLSEDQLEQLLKNRRTSNSTMPDYRHLSFRSELNTPFSFKPGTEILQRMAENSRAEKGIDALQLIGLPVEQGKFAQPEWTDKTLPGYLSNGHLSAIEFYLLFSSLPWWYSHDIILLREQLHVLVIRKDKQLLALLLKHRTNKTFVDNFVQEWALSGGERFVPVLIGLQPGILLKLYGELDIFLKGIHVPAENISFRFFEALLAVIIEAKSFDIGRSDFLARLFRPLINEKAGSRKRVEKLMLKLAIFSLVKGGPISENFDKRDSFIKLLTAFFREEHKVPDETIAMMLGEQLGNMILNQYSGKLSEPFNDTIDILCEMKSSQPLHAIWIDELSAKLGEAGTVSLLIKQLSYSKNARRSAWLLRGLLRKKRTSFLQYTKLSNEEMMGSVAVLLMHDHTALSFVRDTETVFTTVASPASKHATLFWPVVLDYTLKRSAFNQKNLLYSVLSSFSQVGKVSFYQLVADAINFLQSTAYTGNRQPLLQLLYDMADDKKIAQGLNKKEAPVKPANVKQTPVKNIPVIAKKGTEEKRLFQPMLDEGESVYINNAGLVLINPFIKRLFDMLSYTEKNAFKSGEEMTRAIQLLQFIAAGFENAGEQYLFFNKILCGADPLLPLETTIELSNGEKDAAESLLSNVISNWPAMKNASIDGLRGSYLLRDGRLKTSEETWKLVVEKKPYDILLNQLPWGFATIKLPWMPKPVFVQWI